MFSILGLPIASRRQKVVILFNANNGASYVLLSRRYLLISPRISIICGKPRPARDIIVSNSISPGKVIQASTNLCTPRSNLPPRNPEDAAYQESDHNIESGRRETDK